MKQAAALYRLLGDDARLRLLRVLSRERLNVTELTGVLGLAQSGVSRHLGLLKEAGLVAEERDGGFSYYRLAPALTDPGQPGAAGSLAAALGAQFDEAALDSGVRADEARLQEVLRLRKENFDAHTGPDTRDARQLVPGRSWAAWSRALGLLMPRVTVADLGCGEGYLAIEAAHWASRVVAVDRSEVVLDRARALARRRRVANVVWRKGEVEKLPIRDATVDVAMLSQALHHARDPARAVAEAARITRPGGRVLVLDLRTHQEEWVRAKLGDRRLGFADDDLRKMLTTAGLIEVKLGVGSRKAGDPFTVLVASGTKPTALHNDTAHHEHTKITKPTKKMAGSRRVNE
jgi:ArsR family transcriptional regulator